LAALAETLGNVEDVDRAAARLRLSRAMVYRLLAKFIRDPTPSALLPVGVAAKPEGTSLVRK
jgi:hypothetical protein